MMLSSFPFLLFPFLLATNSNINKPPTTTTIPTTTTTKKTTNNGRQFRFVNYGESFTKDDDDDNNNNNNNNNRPTISCDGRIPGGVTLELTHWTDNETPDILYRDTSTEMALVLAKAAAAAAASAAGKAATANPNDHDTSTQQSKSASYYSELTSNAWVLNNHYDTDGVLSVWICLVEPELALQYSELLIQGAEAGDFGEWSSDLGIKLDSTLVEICNRSTDEESAFHTALEELPNILEDFKTTGGKSYEKLWKPGYDYAMQSWDSIQKQEVAIETIPNNNNDGAEEIVIVKRPISVPSISPFALHRSLVQKGLDASVKRVLHVVTTTTTTTTTTTEGSGSDDNNNEASSSLFSYQYEKAGHGWVQKLVQRPMVPSVDSKKLVDNLNNNNNNNAFNNNNKEEEEGDIIITNNNWKAGGSSLVSICQSTGTCTQSVEEVTEALLKYDEGING